MKTKRYHEFSINVPIGVNDLLEDFCGQYEFNKSDICKIAIVEYFRSIGWMVKKK